jgi:hypothetical protein
MAEQRRERRGVKGQILGGILTKDAIYRETDRGAMMELTIEHHETDSQGFVTKTTTYIGKIWNEGAKQHNATGHYVRGAYVGFVNYEPKLYPPYDGRPATLAMDMGSSPANLWVNPAARVTLSMRPVAAKDVPAPQPPAREEKKSNAYDIPF